jgi:hypothetical protein
MSDIQAAVEDWIAHLPEPEWRMLVARTREPSEPLPPAPPTERTTK